MLAATSTAASSVPEPSGDRSSNAIKKGADLLLELLNQEKSQLALVYREKFEKCFSQFKGKAEAQIAIADSQLTKKNALLANLSTQYDRSVQDLETTRNELQQVRAEYGKLMASIEAVGLVYMNGTLHFNDTTAKIVSDFRAGASMQDMVVSHINPNLDTTLSPPDHNTEVSSKAIKPSDFFVFLSGVMEKGRRYAHGLRMHQQCQSVSFSEGSTSTNDATLQDSGFEQDSLLMRPDVEPQGTSPTDPPSLPENKGFPGTQGPTLKRPPSSPAPSSPSNKLHKCS